MKPDFSSPLWDSDDSDNDYKPPPTNETKKRQPKKQQKQNKKSKATLQSPKSKSTPSGVIYIGHVPIDFEEKEITSFLTQFGNVLRMKLSRSKKSGRSKGYAFVDFGEHETAAIVADVLSGYFLMDRRLDCNVLDVKDVHMNMFDGKAFSNVQGNKKKAIEGVNRKKTAKEISSLGSRQTNRILKKKSKLSALGINYLDEVVEVAAKKTTRKRKASVESDPEPAAKKITTKNTTTTKTKRKSSVETEEARRSTRKTSVETEEAAVAPPTKVVRKRKASVEVEEAAPKKKVAPKKKEAEEAAPKKKVAPKKKEAEEAAPKKKVAPNKKAAAKRTKAASATLRRSTRGSLSTPQP